MSLTKTIDEEEFNKGEDTSKYMGKFWKILLSVLGVSLAVFHIYTAYQGSSIMQTSIHFLFALTIAFIIYPASKKSKAGKLGLPVIDIVAVLLAALVNVYYLYHFDRIFLELGYLSPTTADLVLATLTLVLIFEAARRAIGIAFPILAVLALLFALFGPYFPGMFRHTGYSWSSIAIEMYIGQLGIFQGALLSVSANTVAIFIIFGAILLVTGGGAMFIKLAIAIAGRMTGGPAKVSTIASGLFGSISGSTAANTATTGVFTIPLMKKNGYKNHFAGGVESAASCGGQILPPVMGAAAFVLAEVTQINYVVVAASAIIPAILFYTGVWISVHLEAKRTGLQPVKEADMYRLRDVVFTMQFLTLFVPFVVLITFLMMNFTPVISAFWAIISSLVLFSIQTILERDVKGGLLKLVEAGTQGAKTITMIAVILAVAQIIATVIGMTGIGGRLSGLIASIGSTSILLTLALGMVVTIILGMGVPTIAAYMLSASVVASAFATIGLPTLGSHLFILYYAILSGITPPVALAAYVAGGIANAHWFRTAIAACKIGLSGFLIPFMFIYNDALLGHGTVGEVSFAVITAVLGITALAASTIGYMFNHVHWVGRTLFLSAALLLLTPELLLNGIGFVIFAILMLKQWKNRPPKSEEPAAEATEEDPGYSETDAAKV